MIRNNNDMSSLKMKNEGMCHQDELGKLKMDLQQMTKKNQDLEEMLLITTQELQREQENSRGIVLTLTERLMESRETINKLEVENMRLKKDCVLAVELLQCNKSVDKEKLSSTVEKLSDYVTGDQKSSTHAERIGREDQGNHNKISPDTGCQVKDVAQQPKMTKRWRGKQDSRSGTNDNITLLQENAPSEVLHGNEAKQLATKEAVAARKGTPLVENARSSGLDSKSHVKVEGTTAKGVSFIEKLSDKPSPPRRKHKQAKRQGGAREGVPLMGEELLIPATEDTVVRNENFEKDQKMGGRDEELLEKMGGSLIEDSPVITFSVEPLDQGGQQCEKSSFPESEVVAVEGVASINDKQEARKEGIQHECLASEILPPAVTQLQSGQPSDGIPDYGTTGSSYQLEYKTSTEDGTKIMENDKLLANENGPIMNEAETPLVLQIAKRTDFVGDETTLANASQFLSKDDVPSLTGDKLTDGTLGEEIEGKSLTEQLGDNISSTEEPSSLDTDNTQKDKEAEDDLSIEENTPLV